MRICNHCGASVKDDAINCRECGAALDAPVSHSGAKASESTASEPAPSAGTSSLRIALAALIVLLFGLAFWTLIRQSGDNSLNAAAALRQNSPPAAPVRRSPINNTPAPSANTPIVAPVEPTPSSPALDEARRVTVAEAQAALKEGTAVMADVRSRDAYNSAHIKGAISLDEETMRKPLDSLPKDKLIITYCA